MRALTPRYTVVNAKAAVEEIDRNELRSRIRGGSITPETLMASRGTEDWQPAGRYPELKRYFDLASQAPESQQESPIPDYIATTPLRLILFVALGAFAARVLMQFIAPICLIFGGFARFIITSAAFGAVLAWGINKAFRETDNNRLVNISAAGFTAGGMVAWLFSSSGSDWRPIHAFLMALIGTAVMCYGLGLSISRAVPAVIAAAILFPLSEALNPLKPQAGSFEGPAFLIPLVILALYVLPAVPFLLFGSVLGAVIAYAPDGVGAKR